MERKDLRPHQPLCNVYDKAEADAVMDAMEARIKELEQELTNYREDEKGYTEND